jgi:glycosyltransferase involved in cell wall biosynthesis
MKTNMPPTVLFVGALPPPLGGQSNINQQVANSLRSQCRLVIINLSSGRLERSFAYHFQKIIRVLKGICIVLLNARAGRRLYLSTDSGLGLFYNLLIITFARLARYSIFLHYHSFLFIDRRSHLMRLLVMVSGKSATHIFLCDRMRDRFKNEYPFDGPSLVCSNARFVLPKPTPRSFVGDRGFRLGLLSHLNAEKGLYDFLALLRVVKERKLPVSGVLAGPPISEADARAITTAQQELGDYLDFRGPLYGDAKEAFYGEIDAFLFPTHHCGESYGLVLIEALAHGVPVISYARGCIESYIETPAGYVIPTSADFVAPALVHLERWLMEPGAYEWSRVAAGELSRKLYDRAELGLLDLLSVLTEPAAESVALRSRS